MIYRSFEGREQERMGKSDRERAEGLTLESVQHEIRYSFYTLFIDDCEKVYLTVIEGNSIKSNHDSHESCVLASMAMELNIQSEFHGLYFIRLLESRFPILLLQNWMCLEKGQFACSIVNVKCKMSILWLFVD